MRRKTISVNWLRMEVADLNRGSICPADVRRGWNSLLEEVLRATGNYRGFCYLMQSEVPPEQLPGIQMNADRTTKENPDERFVNTDETRRVYY